MMLQTLNMKAYKMENKKEIQFQMRISSINVLKYAQFDLNEIIDKNSIEYQSDFALQILEESSEMAIETTVTIKIQGTDKYFGELKTVIKFNVTPFTAVVKKENGEYQIPNPVMLNLFHIVAGTIRGILHEKFRGTILQGEVYPLMDVNQLLKPKEGN